MRTHHSSWSTSSAPKPEGLRCRRWTVAGGIVVPVLLCMSSSAAAAAENYRLFRFDLGGVYTFMYSTGDQGGGLLLEPMFNITDQLSVGLRQEISFAGGGSFGPSGSSLNVRAQSTSLAKGEFYLTPGPVRPFVGLSAGMYYIAAMSMKDSSAETTVKELGGTYFGVAPQLGVELGFFRLSFLYEAILGAYAEARQTVTTGTEPRLLSRRSLNYVGIEMSFRIGGGRIDKSAE
jgi:hypothetical protein